MGQPTRPTQPSISSGSANEQYPTWRYMLLPMPLVDIHPPSAFRYDAKHEQIAVACRFYTSKLLRTKFHTVYKQTITQSFPESRPLLNLAQSICHSEFWQ